MKIEIIKIFHFFLSKSMLTTCLQLHISQICAKRIKNRVDPCFGKVLKSKVTKVELIISIQLEIADQKREVAVAPHSAQFFT